MPSSVLSEALSNVLVARSRSEKENADALASALHAARVAPLRERLSALEATHESLAFLLAHAEREHDIILTRSLVSPTTSQDPVGFVAARLAGLTHLRRLVLDHNHLGPHHLLDVAHLLETLTNLHELSLDGNPLGGERELGGHRDADEFEAAADLHAIRDPKATALGAGAAAVVAPTAHTAVSVLGRLVLAPAAEPIFAFAVTVGHHPSLATLRLRGAEFGPRAIEVLAIEGIAASRSLEVVDLRGSLVGMRGGWALVDAVRRNAVTTEVILDAERVHMQLAWWRPLQEALSVNRRLALERAPNTPVEKLQFELGETRTALERASAARQEAEARLAHTVREHAREMDRASDEHRRTSEALREERDRSSRLEGELRALHDARERDAESARELRHTEGERFTATLRERNAQLELLLAQLRTAQRDLEELRAARVG